MGCGARAHSGPCPYWLIWLAVLCQGPQSGPAGAWPWHQIACQISRRSGVLLRPSRPPCGRGSEGRKARCDLCGRRLNCRPAGLAGSGLDKAPEGAAGERPASRQPRLGRRRRRGAGGGYARPPQAGGAGGADGPTAPTQWGPGRPGAPTPQPARGRSKARPHEVRPLAGLALLCGGVPPSNGRRLAWPEPPPTLATASRRRKAARRRRPAATLPRDGPKGRAGAGGDQPPRAGRGAARRPLGAGGTAQMAGREPPPPPTGGGPLGT